MKQFESVPLVCLLLLPVGELYQSLVVKGIVQLFGRVVCFFVYLQKSDQDHQYHPVSCVKVDMKPDLSFGSYKAQPHGKTTNTSGCTSCETLHPFMNAENMTLD